MMTHIVCSVRVSFLSDEDNPLIPEGTNDKSPRVDVAGKLLATVQNLDTRMTSLAGLVNNMLKAKLVDCSAYPEQPFNNWMDLEKFCRQLTKEQLKSLVIF